MLEISSMSFSSFSSGFNSSNPFLKTFDASVEHLLTKVSPDNFRPGTPGSGHSNHAKLIKIEDIARLNQQQK